MTVALTPHSATNSDIEFDLSITFSGRVPCGGNAFLGLFPGCYTSDVNPDCYLCYPDWSGTLTGRGDVEGITINIGNVETGKPAQIGVGANNVVCDRC